MAQLIVRNLENDIRDKLRAMALHHGRSMEEEVRDILRAAVITAPDAPRKLGAWCRAQFAGQADPEPFEVEEHRGGVPEPPAFDE